VREKTGKTDRRSRIAPPSIELTIEELVLHGFPAGDRFSIADALERELIRLFSEKGAPQSWTQGGERSSLDGGQFQARPDAKAKTIGAQVAQSVYGGLKP
jgi:hypothetical protein